MSSNAELLICLGVLAALRIGYVIRKVRRESRRPRFGTADPYEGNLVVPPSGNGQHGRHGGHAGHGGWTGGYSDGNSGHGGGVSGHGGHGHGMGGHDAGGFGHHG
jgi:hypothetical protein